MLKGMNCKLQGDKMIKVKVEYQEKTSTRCNTVHTRRRPLLLLVGLWFAFESEIMCV